MLSRVRLDPLQAFDWIPENTFELRAYHDPVDVDAPLSEMRLPYQTVGLVAIRGTEAHVRMTQGVIDRESLKQFDDALRAKGVTHVRWERHRSDGTIKHVTRTL